MEFFIACAPEDHPVIPGSGGFRKARWARSDQGKSGGFRVVYFFIPKPGRIYMASIYAKARKTSPRPIRMSSRSSRLRSSGQLEEVEHDKRPQERWWCQETD
jgi:hypothetical protein